MPPAPPGLRVCGLDYHYDRQRVLHQVAFQLRPGSLTALVGPNGAGKSTLLHLLQGQLQPSAGAVELDGAPVRRCRRRIALMPQKGEIDWRFPITVAEFAGLGRLAASRAGCCDVDGALQRVGLEAMKSKRLDQLSGGQQQRALLARTLVQPADVLLLDEPCAAIDPPSRNLLLGLMRQLSDGGFTLLVSSHDWGPALNAYDRVLVLNQALRADGTPQQVRQALDDVTMGNHCCG
ncbi:MAG: ABC transporter ATP-binding protein [Cyanobacteria bacterium MAG CAR3_bin_5]|nr:ABC transporter ATP-binding protein [Cyanobacteria bacterium MAG CAR3_bin_5]MCY4332552.1 ABC transporter ATP-binding protein [Cyanobacteria bacterium MAG CAR1_bin_15]